MSGYSIDGYCRMMADPNRVVPHLAALQSVIRPGCVVFDIGAGTGLFSIAAAEMGAARVYAIEADPALSFLHAEALSRGVVDRIVAVPQLSTEFAPPEQADVVVMDLRGVVPYHAGNITGALDAAQRLLKPGGVMIPRRDVTFAALVEAPASYRQFVDPWLHDESTPWRACVESNANRTYSVGLEPDVLLTDAVSWHTIDYGVTHSEAAAGTVELMAHRAGIAHGIALWFETELADGVGFSTAPGKCGPIYGQLFLPFVQPIPLAEGDCATCSIRVDPANHSPIMIWSWSVAVARGAVEIACNQQSQFNRHTINPAVLKGSAVIENTNQTTTRLDARYARTEQVLACEVAGETVLLSLDDGLYFGLNSVGTHIWREISPAVTIADLKESMLEHFEVDDVTCERDLLALISQLEERRLITVQGADA